jgi:hypothetical protein
VLSALMRMSARISPSGTPGAVMAALTYLPIAGLVVGYEG